MSKRGWQERRAKMGSTAGTSPETEPATKTMTSTAMVCATQKIAKARQALAAAEAHLGKMASMGKTEYQALSDQLAEAAILVQRVRQVAWAKADQSARQESRAQKDNKAMPALSDRKASRASPGRPGTVDRR